MAAKKDLRTKEGWDIGRLVRVTVLVALMSLFASCSYISHKRNTVFDAITPGDTREKVISAFEATFVSKAMGNAYSKYDNTGCQSPCVERLWFENIMSMDIEAWSIDPPAVGRDVSLSDFDTNIEPLIDRNVTKSLNKASERIAQSLTGERAIEVAECLEGSLTSFEGLVGIYANDYLGLCSVAKVSFRGMVEASEAVEDSVIFYPSNVRGAIVIDCYKNPPGYPPFSVYIVGKDLAEKVAHCL
jgi:hypothetical protein